MKKNKTSIYAIPGWGFSSSILKILEDEKTVVIGLDYSAKIFESIESVANQLAEKIPRNSILLGWSLGGLIATQIASNFPEKIKTLILLSSQPRFCSDINWCGIDKVVTSDFIEQFLTRPEQLIKKFILMANHPERGRRNKTELSSYFLYDEKNTLLASLVSLLKADLRECYSMLTLEILHIINQQDGILLQKAEQLNTLNPNTRTITLENKGHTSFLNDSKPYQNIIREFM